jgi:phage-related protein
MYSDFPVLEEGKNDITWEGNVTQLEILPRWVVL